VNKPYFYALPGFFIGFSEITRLILGIIEEIEYAILTAETLRNEVSGVPEIL